MFAEKDIRFENTIDSELAVCVLPDLFEAVLRTLIENAVKYNDNRPIVNMTATHDANLVKITIEDNGMGITKQEQKKLFRPYYTSDQKEGTGIGLYYAQRIVKAHDGTISVESEPGKGSLFTITIPTDTKL